MIKNYFFYDEIDVEDLGNGSSRKILAYNENLMLVEGSYKSGAIGKNHNHPHEQCTYIIEGEFDFTIGNEKRIIKKGDSLYIEPNIKHEFVCLKDGKLLDIFSPKREDFLK